MKKNLIFYIIVGLLFNPAVLSAQYNDNRDVDNTTPPEGMEMKKVTGGVSVLTPEGGKFRKTNALTYIEEGPEEYSARNFGDVDRRLKKLEEQNRILAEEIRYLKSKLTFQEESADKDVSETAEQ